MKAKKENLREIVMDDPEFIDFLENREEELKKSSIESYIGKMMLYVQNTGLTPSELKDEAEEEEEVIPKLSNRTIKRRLTKFSRDLKSGEGFKKPYSPLYRKTTIQVIKSFYLHHEIDYPKIRCKTSNGRSQTIEDLPSKDNIKKMLAQSNPEYQAIILLMLTSGMRVSDIRKLTIKDYLKSLKISAKEPFDIDGILEKCKEKESIIPVWTFIQTKTGDEYGDGECTTFSSPESVKAINQYLEDRPTFHNEYDSYLFAPTMRNGSVLNKSFAETTLSRRIKRISDRCNLPDKTGAYGLQCKGHPHNLRKFFSSKLKASGMDSLDVDRLLGHKSNLKFGDTYQLKDLEALKNQYKKVLTSLAINEPVNLNIVDNSDEITRLRIEKDQEMAEMQRIQNKQNEEIANLKVINQKIIEELMKKENK